MPQPPENDRSRPAGNGTASNLSGDDTTNVAAATDDDRCTRCQHPITAPESIRVGMGPVCRRRHDAAEPAPAPRDPHCCGSLTTEERETAGRFHILCGPGRCARTVLRGEVR